MAGSLSVADILEFNRRARSQRIKPFVVNSRQQAVRMTEEDAVLGITHEWHVGDSYYLLDGPDGIPRGPAT